MAALTMRAISSLLTAGRLLALAAAGLVISLVIGMLVPVYTDETGWRFQERAAIDGVDILFSDLCGPNTLARPYWYMMPARWFSAIANQALASPLFVRGEGVLCALAWAGLLWILLRRIEPDGQRRRLVGMLAYLLLGLGWLPFILVLSRPEQPLILTTILILIVAFTAPSTRRRTAAAKVFAILVLSTIAQSYHMKGVLYGVVAFVAIGVCARGRRTLPVRLAGLAAITVSLLASAHYWVGRLRCPGDAQLAAAYAGQNMAAGLPKNAGLLDIAVSALGGADPFNYVILATPSAHPMSAWLPPDLLSLGESGLFVFLLTFGWGLALLAALLCLGHCLVVRKAAALTEPRFLLALAMVAVVAIWGASQLHRNVYEAAHILPSLVLAIVLALTLPTVPRDLLVTWLTRLGVVGVPVALVSQAFVLGTFAGPLAAAEARPGYPANQPYSVALVGYAGVRADITRAMAEAGFPADRRLDHLVIDELTYLALQDSHLPIHRLGVFSVWNGEITDPAAYLRSRGSDGIVVGCVVLPPRFRAVAAQAGPICAIAKPTLDRLRR